MKIIKWFCETGFARCVHKGKIEVEDDASNEEIEELVRDEVFQEINWGWNEVSDNA